jgi:hypothetical protein
VQVPLTGYWGLEVRALDQRGENQSDRHYPKPKQPQKGLSFKSIRHP